MPKSKAPERILTIEDNAIARELIAHLVRQQGYEVIEAIDGMSGLVAARNTKPDLVVLDLNLPDISGVDVASMIQDQVPFIVLTVDKTERSLRACIDRGALGYAVKPLNAEDFLRQVRVAIKQGKNLVNLRRALQETQNINKALGLLMGYLQLTEEAAYRAMISRATAERIKIAALAEQLLQAFARIAQAPQDNAHGSQSLATLLGEGSKT